jgi:hypothetical protein
VGNNPYGGLDPLGLDFIAVGQRPPDIFSVLGGYAPQHFSLEYFEESTNGSVKNGTMFNFSIPNVQMSMIDAVELGPVSDQFGHDETNGIPAGIAQLPSSWAWDVVSEVTKTTDAIERIVVKECANWKMWERIMRVAENYPYAEHNLASKTTLSNWPNSKYQALGNNSSTFINTLLASESLVFPDGIGLFVGNSIPIAINEPGYKPYRRH